MSTLVKIIIILLLNITIATSQSKESYNITVNVEGLSNSKGKIMMGLYSSEKEFLKSSYMDVITTINEKKSSVTFNNVPQGIYAISFIHDENDNGKMDTNFMGIPKEDYGCSNNARGFMGPPKWKDAKFNLKSDKTLQIQL